MIDTIASEVLECPVRVYRPQTIGARDMSLVGTIGMIYYLMERNKIVGNYTPSLVLPDISNTMSIRFKCLTKTKTAYNSDTKKKGKLTKVIENLFSEED